jgi:hypothetical protein
MTRSWMRWSAWLCLSLMLWTVAVESTHIHPTQSEAVSCPICVVAQSASPALSATQSAPVFAAVGLFQEQEVVAKTLLGFADLGIRGPPAAL